MYKFTRSNIRKAKIFAIKWLKANKHKFNDSIKSVLRTSNFTLNYKHYFTILNNIEFIYNDIDCHWAETDGITIWLNIWNEDNRWNQEVINYTIVHECLHGFIKRDGIYYTTEYKEHIIMGLVDSLLV